MVQRIADLISFVNMMWVIAGFLAGFTAHTLKHIRKRNHLKRVLMLKRSSNVCFTSVPRFRQLILEKERNVVIAEEGYLLLDLCKLLNSVNITAAKDSGDREIACDEIHIGGPVSNEYTNRYVNHYFKEFKWIVTEEHLKRYQADKNLQALNDGFIELTRDGREGFRFGEQFYPYVSGKKGWSLVVKFVDRADTAPKTVHLLFGCGTNGTEGAVDYLIYHYDEIYRKNKKNAYIGIFEVDGTGRKVGRINWLEPELYLAQEMINT